MRYLILMLFGGLITFSSACYSLGNRVDADEFWSDFRQAVADNEYETIADMTSFPFEIRGVADWMPVTTYDREAFMDVLPGLLKQEIAAGDHDGTGESISMRELVINTERLGPRHFSSDSQIRIGDFEMYRTDDGWRFGFAYWDGESAEE